MAFMAYLGLLSRQATKIKAASKVAVAMRHANIPPCAGLERLSPERQGSSNISIEKP